MKREKSKKQNKFLKALSGVVFVLFVAICGTLIYFNVTHEYFIVYGPSMTPTLNKGILDEEGTIDSVFVSKVKQFTRGDIIVANRNYGIEGESAKYVIKRVIALEGDKLKIDIVDGNYRIILIKNGEEKQEILEEPYLDNYSINSSIKSGFDFLIQEYSIVLDENGFYEIPEQSVFYMGDNRRNSKDCLTYGAKNINAVVGKVDYIIYGGENPYGQVIQQFFGW